MYLADSQSLLTSTLGGVQSLTNVMRNSLPATEGLLLRPASLSERARKIKQKYSQQAKRARTFSSLESSRQLGRKKQDSRVRGRVGKKANRLREVSTS